MGDDFKVLPYGQVAHAIITLIMESKSSIVLICPYFDPWPKLDKAIKNALTRGVSCTIVVREDDYQKKEKVRSKLAEYQGADIRVLDRLHAKLYLSEKTSIITSMNLLESSATQSWEAGVQFSVTNRQAQTLRQPCDDILRESKSVNEATPPRGITNLQTSSSSSSPSPYTCNRRRPGDHANDSPIRNTRTRVGDTHVEPPSTASTARGRRRIERSQAQSWPTGSTL